MCVVCGVLFGVRNVLVVGNGSLCAVCCLLCVGCDVVLAVYWLARVV